MSELLNSFRNFPRSFLGQSILVFSGVLFQTRAGVKKNIPKSRQAEIQEEQPVQLARPVDGAEIGKRRG